MAPDADTLLVRLSRRPWLTLAAVVSVLLLLAYATLIQQELLLAVWVLLVAFFAYLALRFIRAFERLAGAAERLAEDRE